MCSEEMKDAFEWSYCFLEVKWVVRTQAIKFLKSMSERGGSDKNFKNEMDWVWTNLNFKLNRRQE